MRPIIIVLVAAAVGIAGLAGVLVNRLMSDQPVQSQAAVPVVVPSSEEVMVASVDIKPGTVIKADDLRYVKWPVGADDTRFVRRGAVEDPKAGFVGSIARRLLWAGDR